MRKISSVTDTADINGEFTEGNVAQGVSPTILKADIFNTWQRELVNVVEGSGMTLDPNDDGQIFKAINKSFGSGRILNTQTFLSSGNYIPPPGVKRLYVRIWGAGGSGANTSLANTGVASGGGAGYAEGWLDAPAVATAVTVGVGGTPVPANTSANGVAGGSSSFMTISCSGGPGGTVSGAVVPGGMAAGGSVINIRGQGVQGGISSGLGGVGGASFGSFGGLPHNSIAGDDGGFPGGGGAGGSNVTASGRGANGYVIIEEYA